MATFHVNTASGNDSSAGSEAAPFATLSKALSGRARGDSVLLARGTTVGGNYTVPAGVTIGAYGVGAKPVLTGQLRMSEATAVKDVRFTGRSGQIGRVYIGGAASVQISGVEFVDYTNQAIRLDGGRDILVEGCLFQNNFEADHVWGSGVDGFTVRRCVFRTPGGGSGDHMQLNSFSRIAVEDNDFGPVPTGKGAVILTSAADWTTGGGGAFRRNVFDGGNYGIAAGNDRQIVVEGNLFKKVAATNGWGGALRHCCEAGAETNCTWVVRNNRFVGCRAGINQQDGSNVNGRWTIENNSFVDCGQWLQFGDGDVLDSVVRKNAIRGGKGGQTTAVRGNVVITDNWFDGVATTGTLARTGPAGFDAEFRASGAASGYGALAADPVPIRGTDGADTLAGTDGADIIWGDANQDGPAGGDDIIKGGKGNDYISGGPGADVYVAERGGGFDTIRWFEVGKDRIDVGSFGWTSMAEMLAAGATMTPGQIPDGIAFVDLNLGSGDGFRVYATNALAETDFIFKASTIPSDPAVKSALEASKAAMIETKTILAGSKAALTAIRESLALASARANDVITASDQAIAKAEIALARVNEALSKLG
jgi:hypothetical protein